MTELESQILNIFDEQQDSRKPVSRNDLMLLTGFPDRANRDAIASLQEHGYPIVSLGHGYYLGSREDVMAYVRREKGRAITILSKLRKIVPQAAEVIRQLELWGECGNKI